MKSKISKTKDCPICGHLMNVQIDICEECGWDFPVIIGDSEQSRQSYKEKLEKSKQLFSKHKSGNENSVYSELLEEDSFKKAFIDTLFVYLSWMVLAMILVTTAGFISGIFYPTDPLAIRSFEDLFLIVKLGFLVATFVWLPFVTFLRLGPLLIRRIKKRQS